MQRDTEMSQHVERCTCKLVIGDQYTMAQYSYVSIPEKKVFSKGSES